MKEYNRIIPIEFFVVKFRYRVFTVFGKKFKILELLFTII